MVWTKRISRKNDKRNIPYLLALSNTVAANQFDKIHFYIIFLSEFSLESIELEPGSYVAPNVGVVIIR